MKAKESLNTRINMGEKITLNEQEKKKEGEVRVEKAFKFQRNSSLKSTNDWGDIL